MKKGLIRRGPRCSRMTAASAIPGSPPVPDPINTPVRSWSSSLSATQPESTTACLAAAIAQTMNRSILRRSLLETQSSSLKLPSAVSPSGRMPAILQGRSETSNALIGDMPESPARSRFHIWSTPTPRGVTAPRPVTTMRLIQRGTLYVKRQTSTNSQESAFSDRNVIASCTVWIFSAASSGISHPNSSSKAFEEEFGCEIPDDAAEKIQTVQDAITFLSENADS